MEDKAELDEGRDGDKDGKELPVGRLEPFARGEEDETHFDIGYPDDMRHDDNRAELDEGVAIDDLAPADVWLDGIIETNGSYAPQTAQREVAIVLPPYDFAQPPDCDAPRRAEHEDKDDSDRGKLDEHGDEGDKEQAGDVVVGDDSIYRPGVIRLSL
jgi:hypothetical protein